MKHLLLSILLGLSGSALAQDAIYTKNGHQLPDARLTDVQDDKVSFTINGKTQTFKRENILFAFTSNGNYLVINELSTNTTKAQEQLKTFLAAPPRNDDRDYLIQAVPLKVIPAMIAYESDQLVNYNTLEGKSGSISKGELVAILHRDGHHTILRPDYGEVSPLLEAVHDRIRPNASPKSVQTKPEISSGPEKASENPPRNDSSVVIKQTEVDIAAKYSLSPSQQQLYRKKSLQKVNEFVAYLNVITNKSLPTTVRDEAIRNACELFMEGSTMEVTSTSQPGSRKYTITEYLNRLKLISYSSTKIEWSEVNFIKELTQAVDGSYYGLISGSQKFTGSSNGRVKYIDYTDKNVRVKLKRGIKTQDGEEVVTWDLLLGSISVAHQ
ncbi:hypothetical protein [Spirosoma rhododendri]|uniref:Uncharacterized protein n=1 Tax=Spirosoma rhododendri TaxID=2728024 RepID=A0A7L5DMW7_9BACT|nr:hypothetical protein [Spirosoma rhododendri]QJD78882.1 hypothetical protein HH216_10900 [Spirosoma rhododendri]